MKLVLNSTMSDTAPLLGLLINPKKGSPVTRFRSASPAGSHNGSVGGSPGGSVGGSHGGSPDGSLHGSPRGSPRILPRKSSQKPPLKPPPLKPTVPPGLAIVAKPQKRPTKSKRTPPDVKAFQGLITPKGSPETSRRSHAHVHTHSRRSPRSPRSPRRSRPDPIIAPIPRYSPNLDEKRELLFKLQMMRKRNPTLNVPEFTLQSEASLMRLSYNMFVKRLTIDSTVENYKQYMIYGFMAIEMLVGRFTPLNMTGFTMHQQSMMNSYDKLLIELGEKVDPDSKSRLPVELRLGILVCVNTVIFVMSRIMFTPDVGTRLLQNVAPSVPPAPTGLQSTKRMRRPDETPQSATAAGVGVATAPL